LTERVERRLAAVLSADVVGYTRLVRADEEGTLARLQAHRAACVDLKIEEYRGRIVKEMGDGLLVEFGSVVDAVRCAIDVQRGMATRVASEPEPQKIIYRIGINLGDVIVDGADIHGDGVNIATRMQEIAPPGGVSVSGIVFDSVKNKLAPHFEDLGPQQVKNVGETVRAYRVVIDPEHARNEGPTAHTAHIDPERKTGPTDQGSRTHIPTVARAAPARRIVSFMGAVQRKGTWEVPQRLTVTTLMGAVELDFRDAVFGPGTSTVDITALMGAVSIKVPPFLRVECGGAGILGAFESLSLNAAKAEADDPLLRITGTAVMGAVEIKT
jgi:class 3 adenylate cyclase